MKQAYRVCYVYKLCEDRVVEAESGGDAEMAVVADLVESGVELPDIVRVAAGPIVKPSEPDTGGSPSRPASVPVKRKREIPGDE